MRRLRVAASLVFATTALAQAAVGCGDDDNAPVSNGDGGAQDGALAEGGEFDATAPSTDAGAFTVVDVADTPCAPRDVGNVLFAASPFDPILSISALGEKRVVQRSSGFVITNADGSSPTATIAGSRAAVALDATTIAAAVSDFDGPRLSLYDANGTAKASNLLAYNSPPYGVTVGAANGEGLMVWGSPFGVFARGIATTDFIGPPFAVSSSAAIGSFAVSVARKPSGEFAAAFSGVTPDEQMEARMSIVRMTTTGRIATGFHLEVSKVGRRVVQLVPRAKGWALLFDYGPNQQTHLALLDDEGRFDGPVYRFAGVTGGYGLASSGGELAVLALHSSAASDAGVSGDAGDGVSDASAGDPNLPRAAMRAFDDKGAPLGDWTCFGDGVQSHGGSEGAIFGEDNGYAVAFSKANGDVVYARVDRRGN